MVQTGFILYFLYYSRKQDALLFRILAIRGKSKKYNSSENIELIEEVF